MAIGESDVSREYERKTKLLDRLNPGDVIYYTTDNQENYLIVERVRGGYVLGRQVSNVSIPIEEMLKREFHVAKIPSSQ